MKRALVVEGGAMRIAFASGAMDALLDENIKFDYIIGSSAGIANSISFASNQKGRNYRIMTEYPQNRKYMSIGNLINPFNRSYYGLKFTFEDIPKYLVPFDYKTFQNFPGEIISTATNMHTGKADHLIIDRNNKRLPEVIASCSMPLLFPIQWINNTPYMDGGTSDPVPYKKSIADGCDKVLALLSREQEFIKKEERISKFAIKYYRKYPNYCKTLIDHPNIYNKQIREINQLEKDGEIYTLRPKSTINFSRLEKDLNKIKTLYQEGYNSVTSNIKNIKNYLELD